MLGRLGRDVRCGVLRVGVAPEHVALEIDVGEIDEGGPGKIEDGRIDLMPQAPGEEEEEEADWLSEFEDKGLDIESEDEDDWLASLEEAEEDFDHSV